MSKVDLKGYLSWLQDLQKVQSSVEHAGVRAGSNEANRAKTDRSMNVVISSKSFTVRGGRIVPVERILDATKKGVDDELGRVLK